MGDRIARPHARSYVTLLAGCCVTAAVALPARTAPAASELPAAAGPLDAAAAARFAALALKCLHQEYPNHLSHTLSSDSDARPPHELTPAFYGCLDWHSDVHGHWLLVRLIRLFPDAPFVTEARTALGRSLTPQNIAGEIAYLRGAGRASFERPYGLPWLHYPIRIGEHDQTAFALALIWDWAAVSGDVRMRDALQDAAQRFYLHDRNCPLAYEPSGEDFLSPCLAEADFMRRVLSPPAFAQWLSGFLPQIPRSTASTAAAPAWL